MLFFLRTRINYSFAISALDLLTSTPDNRYFAEEQVSVDKVVRSPGTNLIFIISFPGLLAFTISKRL